MTGWQGTQAELEAILDSITDGFFVLDGDWRFVFLNTQAERWWRAHGEEKPGKTVLLGENAWEMFPEAVGSELHSALYRAAREQTTGARSSLMFRRGSGGSQSVSTRSPPD